MHEPGKNPLAHYLFTGQPDGPWRYEVITSEDSARPVPPELRIALHFHAYYPDLLPEMLTRLIRNRIRPDLFVSVPTELVRDEVESMLKHYSGRVMEIQVVPNRGRDIGPFLTGFGAAFVDRYDVVGHLHTKKTVDIQNAMIGKTWCTFLMENLLGGRSTMADTILGRMAADPSIGMVFPDDPNVIGWGKNRPYAEPLAHTLKLGILPKYFAFLVGTMFWARVKSLLPVFHLCLDWQD
ncbi:MAG: rhamnan synthesis F family protein [Candidatus Xenobiia bacterium LiM19]